MNRSSQIILYLIGICIVLSVGYFLTKKKLVAETAENICAQDSKECNDGTFVSREGQECEFAVCTSGDKETLPDKVASPLKSLYDSDKKIGFDYLDNFYLEGKLNKYVLPVQWPPELSVSTSTFNCKKGGSQILPTGKTEWRYVSGRNYCLTTQTEGAAGSVYTTYTYKGLIDRRVISLSFISRAPQCENYNEPQKGECEEEKKLFDIDEMVDKIFQSIKFDLQ